MPLVVEDQRVHDCKLATVHVELVDGPELERVVYDVHILESD